MIQASAVILCWNEKAVLRKCLESLKDFHEVIVVDAFSTDGSRSIAREFPNVLVVGRLYDNTTNARNEGLKWCRNEWRLIIDADEYLSPEMIKLLQEMDFNRWDYTGLHAIKMPRFNMVNDIGPIQWPEWTIHLVRRDVLHGGHPLHSNRAKGIPPEKIGSFPAQILLPNSLNEPRVIHQKTALQWMSRARIYWYCCPYTFKDGPPPGAEDLIPPAEHWDPNRPVDVWTDFIEKGLYRDLTDNDILDLTVDCSGWGRISKGGRQ